MKANAPEKIYISDTELNDAEHCVIWFKNQQNKNDIEYTRTDAFIKKAFEFFGEHLWEYIDIKNANCDTIINIDVDTLEEHFRNYMKGE